MNKEESLALYAQGRDAWNEWANGMIADREALEAAGDWVAGSDSGTWNDATRDWHAAARANFSEHRFRDHANFKDFLFPGDAWFDSATFSGYAKFDSAIFNGDAGFQSAAFNAKVGFDGARFCGVTFSSNARFDGTSFHGITRFGKAIFCGDAKFVQTAFNGRTVFNEAGFEKEANFNAMQGGDSFSLAAVRFRAVPNFIEAHFDEAPRLDNLHIAPIYKGDPDLPAQWRALKRLAVQALDHEQGLVFFKCELRSRRWAELKYWHLAYWPNLAYQFLSDYGRSAWRPFLIWIAVIVGFWFAYLGQAGESKLYCVAGSDNFVLAAFQLSLRKALLFFGIGSTDKLKQIYACLYGVNDSATTTAGPLPPGFIPVIPDFIAFLSIAQLAISAVLIFLVLLALRNQFRIK